MLGYEEKQRSLTREQKQVVGLLSIGTFLEYFDLMLYVHMSVVLNELFFQSLIHIQQQFFQRLLFAQLLLLDLLEL
jgi:hypothetical protein